MTTYLLGAVLRLWHRFATIGIKKADERDPEAPRDLDRGHARSEAEAAKEDALSAADAAEVAELHEYFQEIGTGELPIIQAFDIDPLGAPIPADLPVAEPALFDDVTAHWLSLFTWTAPADTVPLSSVQVPEPDPLELDGFTTGWTKSEMAALVAEVQSRRAALVSEAFR